MTTFQPKLQVIYYLTYYPCALALWAQIHTINQRKLDGSPVTKKGILKSILKMEFRRSWLRDILEDQK